MSPAAEWFDFVVPPQPETIAAAALLNGDEIITMAPPARHHTIMYSRLPEVSSPAFSNTTEEIAGMEQGFVTNTGRFVGRREAAGIAVAAGQIVSPRWGSDLYSEDLW